jgi:hypothetical protein
MTCLVLPMHQTIARPDAGTWEISCRPCAGGARWDIEFFDARWPPIALTVTPLDEADEQVTILADVPNDLIARTYWRCAGPRPLERWLAFTFASAPGAPHLSRRARRALARLILEDRWPVPEDLAA